MTATQRLRLLQGVTLAGIAIAALALAWPAQIDVAPLAPVVSAPPAAGDRIATAPDTTLSDAIIDANIFSVDREPPVGRTTPATLATTDDGTSTAAGGLPSDVPADSVAPQGDAPAAEDRVPRAYGVINGPAGVQALLRLQRTPSAALLYREGDRAGGYRVVRIGTDRVTLDGPGGELVLRLTPRRSAP